MSPRVAVIVVNYNGRDHLEYCLPSLEATDYPAFDIVVVDNASRDGSAAFVAARHPTATLLTAPENRGWAGGNNIGLRHALAGDYAYVVLQNNDTRVDRRWLREAVPAMERNPRLGILGFRVLNEYRPDEDPDGSRFEALVAAWDGPVLQPTDHVSGCAMLLRLEVVRDVGFFDERYFVFGEEDDFVRRARSAGYEQARLDVPVWHHHGGTWRRRPLRWSVMAIRNDIRAILKNEPPAGIRARLAWLVRFVASPRVEYDRDVSHFRRLRPGRWPVNVALLAYGFLWNLVFLPETLAARRRDYRRVALARDRVSALPATTFGPLP